MANSVELINPIESVSNLPNGTPEYEKLFIFAELLGERRERSVLTLNSNQGGVSLQTQLSNTNVNMLGVDYKPDVNNSAKFTTNWTDNETNDSVTLEGFGINKIDVNINSSFMPRVTIEFVDIKGLTFYNLGENSPYSLLVDFPPPIFKMTLKGYYGKSLDYDLHLVKQNTRFDSNTGNYYINVEFVARTFAPLADIPFKFSELVALMATGTQEQTDPKEQEAANQNINDVTNQDELNFNPKFAPKNTYELVEKLKRLTDELKDIKNTSKEGKIFDDAREGVTEGNNVVQYMNSFSSFVGANYENNAQIVVKNNNQNPDDNTKDDGGEFRIINSVIIYNSIIKESNDSGNNSNTQPNKLYLAVLNKKIRNGNISGDTTSNTTILDGVLKGYKNSLISRGINFAESNIKKGFIGESVIIKNYRPSDITLNDANQSSNNYDEYLALDVTKFYTEIEKVLKKKRDVVDQAQSDLVGVINTELKNILGFKPSIYNIFKILCDDLDVFFKQLGKVSKDSETHHNKFFDLIIDQIQEEKSKKVTKKIYPFPLYVKEDTTCGVTRKVRRIPDFELEEQFPEVKFVNEFIDAMIALKKKEDVKEMRTQIESNGNNKWIPITPADSRLHGGASYESPYANLENVESVNGMVDVIYTRLINRFYIASQYTFGESFYSNDRKSGFIYWGNKEFKRNDLIKYIAKAEAVNLANSITNDAVLQGLKDKAKKGGFIGNPQLFYDTVSNLPIYSNIPNNVLNLTDDVTFLYRDRNDNNFVGFEIKDTPPSIRTNGDENSTDPIDQYLNEDNTFLDSVANFFVPSNENPINNFTSENIPYFPDFTDGDSDNYTTKFLNGMELNSIFGYTTDNIRKFTSIYNGVKATSGYDPAGRFSDGNYASTLATILALYLDDVRDFISDTSVFSSETQAFVLTSMFGRARSYFSLLGDRDSGIFNSNVGNVNSLFLNPAVVETPRFSTYYMGGLLEYNLGGTLFTEVNSLIDDEESDWFNAVSVNGGYIKDDANRIENLSTNDGQLFFNTYNRWSNPPNNNSGFIQLRKDLRKLITDIDGLGLDDDLSDRQEAILRLIKQGNLRSIDDDMVVKTTILNYSEYTFNNEINTEITYEPLSVTVLGTSGDTNSQRSANDLFFNTFWERLGKELPDRDDELNEIEGDFRSVVDDEDIKTQLYYSFKNISDKWVSGIDTAKRGFPLNIDENDSLISKFAFVDRAMNPIGEDVIINAEALIEMSQDYDINMFQVFSRLLSLNGFEFFPLQNFMSFNAKDGNWKDAFKTFTTLEQKQTPAFVCMYIGGTSSTLENSSSAFDNDGILDLEGEGLPDFQNVGDCSDSQEVIDSENRSKSQNEARFKYSEPKAFRVRFAEQNQSFFTNIEIEGRDFPETADSLAILSRIAGDGKTTAPIPKGQNMFSIYENRAYSISVTMLGNVMIQPTQYFQLENIPMYSGAYMITDVIHTVRANHMTTKFKGVKVLKFPNPFVKNFATIVGIESGTSEDLTGTDSVRNIRDAVSARTLPDKNSGKYYNEQFSLKISP